MDGTTPHTAGPPETAQAETAQAEASPGRAAVQAHLIDPLERDGMRRGQRSTPEQHADFLDRLKTALAYMDAQSIQTLAEVVRVHAGGRALDVWPALQSITAHAWRIQRPPASESRLVTSWLGSVEGPAARRGGYLVELYVFLRKYGRPPSAYDMTKIRAEADARARHHDAIRRRAAKGGLSGADQAELDHYAAELARVEAIIAAKEGVA